MGFQCFLFRSGTADGSIWRLVGEPGCWDPMKMRSGRVPRIFVLLGVPPVCARCVCCADSAGKYL